MTMKNEEQVRKYLKMLKTNLSIAEITNDIPAIKILKAQITAIEYVLDPSLKDSENIKT